MHTPWGPSQSQHQLIPGIVFYETASHAGYKVSADLNAKLPDYFRAATCDPANGARGWYEEDCDWGMPFVALEAEILAATTDAHARKIIAEKTHIDVLKNWKPLVYERFYGVTLQPGESHCKDWDRERATKRAAEVDRAVAKPLDQDVAGAVGPDGGVYSDADPGL